MIRSAFFDLDDTLYSPSSGIWDEIGERINLFIHERLGLPQEHITALRQHYFTTYGTSLRGLALNHGIDPDDYLKYVHDIPIEERLQPDPALRAYLLSFPMRRIVFTNADERHALRVLGALGLEECFEQIIDIHKIYPSCKPLPDAFLTAMHLSGEEHPENIVIFDDSVRNLEAARKLGFYTILIGKDQPNPAYHQAYLRLIDVPHDFADQISPTGDSATLLGSITPMEV